METSGYEMRAEGVAVEGEEWAAVAAQAWAWARPTAWTTTAATPADRGDGCMRRRRRRVAACYFLPFNSTIGTKPA